ncbi:hypothetical protein [Microbacterium sp. YY-01]|uniref:hypothetical protein n=1 Tax=Microbacterium sp. YY-01 TaxID=3421634 RepID=UPI003D16A301
MNPFRDKSVVDWIDDLGVTLEYTNDLPSYRLGAYLDDERRILVRMGLTHVLEQETLHHEYAHALYRDRSCHPATEWRAWREAARLIVDPVAYARAERLSLDSGYIAHELGTTKRVIDVYRQGLLRGEIRLAA